MACRSIWPATGSLGERFELVDGHHSARFLSAGTQQRCSRSHPQSGVPQAGVAGPSPALQACPLQILCPASAVAGLLKASSSRDRARVNPRLRSNPCQVRRRRRPLSALQLGLRWAPLRRESFHVKLISSQTLAAKAADTSSPHPPTPAPIPAAGAPLMPHTCRARHGGCSCCRRRQHPQEGAVSAPY